MQKLTARFGLVSLNVAVFFVEEGWIIAAVAFLPFWVALFLVTVLLAFFSMASSYLCGLGDLPAFVERWLEKQKDKANKRLTSIVRGAVWTSSLTTAIVVSPTTSAVMLHVSGIRGMRAYVTDLIFSLISGAVWCMIYGGGLVVLRKVF